LSQQPANEELKKQIRAIDLELRREFFRQKTFTDIGAGLLLICAGIFFAAGKTAVTLHRRLPQPQPLLTLDDTETKWTRLALWASRLDGNLGGPALAMNFTARSPLPSSTEALAAMLDESKNAPDNHSQLREGEAPASRWQRPETSATSPVRQTPRPPASPNRAHPAPIDLPSEEESPRPGVIPRAGRTRRFGVCEHPHRVERHGGKEKNLRWKTAVPLPGN